MDRVLEALSDYAVSVTYDQLPKKTVHEVKRRVIDTLGCAMGSYTRRPPEIARAYALEVSSKPGSTILGTRHQSAPELAAFANCVMARYSDFNDMSVGRKAGHPSDNIPSVLAAAEYAGADLRSAIAGIIVAYEIQDRVGDAGNSVVNGGWDYVIFGALSSAAGTGVAMALNKEQVANALAIAATTSGGLFQTRVGKLSEWKGCAAANATRNGTFAALLARRGLTGPEQAFDGPCGFKKQFDLAGMQLPTFGNGGTVPYILEQTRFKNFPCDYEAQCCVTPAVALHKALKGNMDQVARIEIETYTHGMQASADTPEKWNPTTRETADHSLPYVVAVVLSHGTLAHDDFSLERIRDPKTHAVMQKIEVRATEEFDRAWPEAYPFRITVTTKSGEKHVQEVFYAKGHPKNPMSDQDIEEKFRQQAEPVMGKAAADRALQVLWRLEDLKKVEEAFAPFVLKA